MIRPIEWIKGRVAIVLGTEAVAIDLVKAEIHPPGEAGQHIPLDTPVSKSSEKL